MASLADGECYLTGLSHGEDVRSTRKCLQRMGTGVPLDCGNSGTTIRLLMGLLAGKPYSSTLTGDASLAKRPMERIAIPLRMMGAEINANFPVHIQGAPLHGIDYELPIASAQLKSAILLAALQAEGRTTLTGKIQSRDHTERMLRYFGVNLEWNEEMISIVGPQRLKAKPFQIPGDPSSAAFWIGGAAIVPGGDVQIHKVSLNPTRLAFYEVLRTMGAAIRYTEKGGNTELYGTIRGTYAPLKGIKVPQEVIPYLIDEIPLLSVIAVFAEGETVIKGIEELRYKESDRIEAVCENLKKMGAEVHSTQDSIVIEGPQKIHGATIETFHDHRIAMAFSIAALQAEGTTTIQNSEIASISYPNFYETLEVLYG